MEKIRELLLKTGKEHNICKDGFKNVATLNKFQLVEYYKTIPDWCLERNYPNLYTLEKYFSKMNKQGLFVSCNFKGRTIKTPINIFHNCKGTIQVAMDYDKAIIPMLYFANNCDIRICCNQQENKGMPISIPIYIFGDNNIEAEDNEFAKYTIYKKPLI